MMASNKVSDHMIIKVMHSEAAKVTKKLRQACTKTKYWLVGTSCKPRKFSQL